MPSAPSKRHKLADAMGMSDHALIDLLVRQANEKDQFVKALQAQGEDNRRFIGELQQKLAALK